MNISAGKENKEKKMYERSNQMLCTSWYCPAKSNDLHCNSNQYAVCSGRACDLLIFRFQRVAVLVPCTRLFWPFSGRASGAWPRRGGASLQHQHSHDSRAFLGYEHQQLVGNSSRVYAATLHYCFCCCTCPCCCASPWIHHVFGHRCFRYDIDDDGSNQND